MRIIQLFVVFYGLQIIFTRKISCNEPDSLENTFKENLIELENYFQKETFVSNISLLTETSTVKIWLRSSVALTQLLTRLNLDFLIIHIREYFQLTSEFYVFKINYFNIFYTNKCKTLNLTQNCYNISNSTENINAFIDFDLKLKEFGNYVVCFKFMGRDADNFSFTNEKMCLDWILSPLANPIHSIKAKQIKYKPLFIVLMYLLCFLVLFPIATFKYVREKSQDKNMLKDKIRLDKNDLFIPLLESEPYYNIVRTNTIQTELGKSSSSVRFDLYDSISLNDLQEKSNHILDDKPWCKNVSTSHFSCSKEKEIVKSDACGPDILKNVKQRTSNNEIRTALWYESNI